MPSPTIDEVKKAKIKVENSILKIINDFEKTNKVRIEYINVERDYGEDKVISAPDRGKPGHVKNIDMNMDIDFT